MKIGSWSKGIDTVEVDGVIKALLIHSKAGMELREYNADRQQTTEKYFGVVTMEQVEKMYGELDKAPVEPIKKQSWVNNPSKGKSYLQHFQAKPQQETLDL